ncbi:MAG TPA: hypothetical protein VMU50_06140 [Polyangia bacterium]|jgi:hypothetical protein|nr:hypothetical protein [Polyangia bacterium]
MADDATLTDMLDPDVVRAEREIERTREQVAMSVLALRDEVARRADWREWVRARPAAFLGAAFLLGLWWGQRHRDS